MEHRNIVRIAETGKQRLHMFVCACHNIDALLDLCLCRFVFRTGGIHFFHKPIFQGRGMKSGLGTTHHGLADF